MSLADNEAARQIIDKFKSSNVVVSFAEVARASKANGRKALAAMVINYYFLCYAYSISCMSTATGP